MLAVGVLERLGVDLARAEPPRLDRQPAIRLLLLVPLQHQVAVLPRVEVPQLGERLLHLLEEVQDRVAVGGQLHLGVEVHVDIEIIGVAAIAIHPCDPECPSAETRPAATEASRSTRLAGAARTGKGCSAKIHPTKTGRRTKRMRSSPANLSQSILFNMTSVNVLRSRSGLGSTAFRLAEMGGTGTVSGLVGDRSDPGRAGLGMAEADRGQRAVRRSGRGRPGRPIGRVDSVRIGRGRRPGDAGKRATISPSSAERGIARGLATRTIGGTAAPGGSVRKVSDQGRPGSQGRFSAYETVTSGWGPGSDRRGGLQARARAAGRPRCRTTLIGGRMPASRRQRDGSGVGGGLQLEVARLVELRIGARSSVQAPARS